MEYSKAAAGLEHGGGKSLEAQKIASGAANKGSGKVGTGKPMIHEMHIKKAANGHEVHHFHKPVTEKGQQPDAKYVVQAKHEGDLDGLHDHMEEHMGSPNEGEEEMMAGGGANG